MPKLTLEQANKIIEVAFAKAREMKVKPLAIAVLDEAGHVKSLQREDNASMLRNDVAIGKAWAAVGMGVASRTLLERAKGNPQFFGALSATARASSFRRPGGGDQGQGRHVIGAPAPRAARARRTRRSAWAGITAAGLAFG